MDIAPTDSATKGAYGRSRYLLPWLPLALAYLLLGAGAVHGVSPARYFHRPAWRWGNPPHRTSSFFKGNRFDAWF